MTTTSTGLRERKKAATRSAIAAAALRLSLDRGHDDVTVEAIADAAGISPRTFFNYFPSKEAAVVAPSAERWAVVTDVLGSRPAPEPAWTALRTALVDTFGDLADRGGWSDALRLARTSPSLMAHQRNDFISHERRLITLVAARMAADPGDLRPRVVVAAAVAAVRVAVQRWLDDTDAHDLTELLEQAMDLIAEGTATATAAVGETA